MNTATMIWARVLLLGILVNAFPAFALGTLTEGETLDLIHKLEDPHSGDSERAVPVTALAKNARTGPELARILRSSPYELVRLRAVRTLGLFRWNDSEFAISAEVVSAALRVSIGDVNESEQIRCAAVGVLSRVRPIAEVNTSVIIGALSQKEISTTCTLSAIANIAEHLRGDNQELALKVSSHLTDTSPIDRSEAVRVLGKLGPSAKIAVPDLISALSSADDHSGYSIAEVLRNIGTPESAEAARQYTAKQYEIGEARAKQYEKEWHVFDSFLLSTLSRPILCCIPIVMLALGFIAVACLYRWPTRVAAITSILVFMHWPLAMTIPPLGNIFGDNGGNISFGIFEVIVSPGFILIRLIRYMMDPPPNVTVLNPIIPITNGFVWGVFVYLVLSWYGRRKRWKTGASNHLIDRPAAR